MEYDPPDHLEEGNGEEDEPGDCDINPTDLILSLHAAFPKANLYPSLRGSPPRRA